MIGKLVSLFIFFGAIALAGALYFAPRGEPTLQIIAWPLDRSVDFVVAGTRPWNQDFAARLQRWGTWASYEWKYTWWRWLYSEHWIAAQTVGSSPSSAPAHASGTALAVGQTTPTQLRSPAPLPGASFAPPTAPVTPHPAPQPAHDRPSQTPAHPAQ